MSELQQDTKALRREIYAGVLAFVIGSIVVLSVVGWLIVRFVLPEARWWEVVHTSVTAILISIVFGGLGSAALSMRLLSTYHHRRGFYHCLFCGRTLRSVGERCPCRPSEKNF